METIFTVLQIIGTVVGGLVVIGGAIGIIYFAANRRVRSEKRQKTSDDLTDVEARLRPYKEAAEGWEKRCKQLEDEQKQLQSELGIVKADRERLRRRVAEVEGNYLKLAETNQRQQAEIDGLGHQLREAIEIKDAVLKVAEAMRGIVPDVHPKS